MGFIADIISRFSAPAKLFHEGQEVTPKEKPVWTVVDSGKLGVGPKYNEVVKVLKYESLFKGRWVIFISGYKDKFFEDAFVPVISDGELEEMLKEEVQTIEPAKV